MFGVWPSLLSWFKSNKHTDDNENSFLSSEPVDHIHLTPEFCSCIFILGKKISCQHPSSLSDCSVGK